MSRKPSKRVRYQDRSDARRLALQILYQSEMMEESPVAIVEESRYVAEEGIPSEYAKQLLQGVAEHQEEIDDQVRAVSENWTLTRMPAVDRSLLRLSVYEMLYVDDVPLSVSINEAVELAKGFGGEDDSHRFVNGVLGRIARAIERKTQNSADIAGEAAYSKTTTEHPVQE